jgi:hypothetical protein
VLRSKCDKYNNPVEQKPALVEKNERMVESVIQIARYS